MLPVIIMVKKYTKYNGVKTKPSFHPIAHASPKESTIERLLCFFPELVYTYHQVHPSLVCKWEPTIHSTHCPFCLTIFLGKGFIASFISHSLPELQSFASYECPRISLTHPQFWRFRLFLMFHYYSHCWNEYI